MYETGTHFVVKKDGKLKEKKLAIVVESKKKKEFDFRGVLGHSGGFLKPLCDVEKMLRSVMKCPSSQNDV